jgi:exonuclease VII small subunit
VRILELGQMGLDESLKYWERGEALAKRCEEHLAGAARRVEAAIQGTTKTTENDGNSGNSLAETAETPGSTSAAGSTGGADGERTTGVAEGDSTASYYGSF